MSDTGAQGPEGGEGRCRVRLCRGGGCTEGRDGETPAPGPGAPAPAGHLPGPGAGVCLLSRLGDEASTLTSLLLTVMAMILFHHDRTEWLCRSRRYIVLTVWWAGQGYDARFTDGQTEAAGVRSLSRAQGS